MALHVMLMITIPKFWCSIGPGVNEYAAGEPIFSLSLLFTTRYDVCVYFFSFSFRLYVSFLSSFVFHFRWISQFTAIHLNQCYLKETDSKEKVCMLLLMLISFMFLFAGDWQEKESAHSFEIFFLWNVLLFASWTFCFRLNWKWVVWLLCCVEWRPIVNYLEFGREWLWIKSLESLHTCISLDDVDIVNYRHFVELRF